jgi:hypothetical protein
MWSMMIKLMHLAAQLSLMEAEERTPEEMLTEFDGSEDQSKQSYGNDTAVTAGSRSFRSSHDGNHGQTANLSKRT